MLGRAHSPKSASRRRAGIRGAPLPTVLLSLVLAGLGSSSAGAADVPADAADPQPAPVVATPGWTFTVAPYVWAPSMSGDVGYGAVQAHFDTDFSKILDHLDFAAMGVVEARYDRFSLFSDLLYMKLSAEGSLPYGADAEAGTEMVQWTPAAAYSLIKTDRGNLDVLAGARLWSVETSLNVDNLPVYGNFEHRHTARWVDGVVGIKGRYAVTQSVFVSGWALAGGSADNTTWDLLGAVGYKINDRFSAMAGYRAQSVDYQDGPFIFDAVIQGPILGGTIKF